MRNGLVLLEEEKSLLKKADGKVYQAQRGKDLDVSLSRGVSQDLGIYLSQAAAPRVATVESRRS